MAYSYHILFLWRLDLLKDKVKKALTTILLALLMSMGAWADGPSYQKPELIKQQLDESSDGLIHSWTYETDGYIFHGRQLGP